MLLPFTALIYYGAGAGAAVDVIVVSASAGIKGDGRLAGVNTSTPTGYARATIGRQMRAVNTSTATSPSAGIKARGRMAGIGKVNELSQDDVTGAVMESFIESNMTMKQAMVLLLERSAATASSPWTEVIESGYTAAEIMRLLAAVMAGKSSGGSTGAATVAFRDLGDTKDRVTAAVDGSGNRTTVTRDAT